MKYLVAFARFWWNFIVGDDWFLAAGVVVALVLTASLDAWWLLPPAVAIVLAVSLRRATQ